MFAWTLVSPDLFGNPAHGLWWAPGITFNYNEVNTYCGAVALLLTPLALLSPSAGRRRWALFLLALAALAAGVVYRAPLLYDAAQALPFLRNAANHRLLLVVQFALALLAALGVEALREAPAGSAGAWPGGWRLGVGLLALGGVGAPWLLGDSVFQLPAGDLAAAGAWRDGLLRALALLALGAGLIATVLALRARRPRAAGAALALLPVLALADLWQAHGDYNPIVAPAAYYPATATTRFLQAQPAPTRVTRLIPPSVNLVYGFSLLTGYDALTPRLYDELITFIDPQIPRNNRRHFNAVDPLQSRIWNLLGVSYVLAPPGDDPNYLPDVRQETPGGATAGPIAGANRPGQTFVSSHANLAAI